MINTVIQQLEVSLGKSIKTCVTFVFTDENTFPHTGTVDKPHTGTVENPHTGTVENQGKYIVT